ncbi:MAG TPA: D-alanyl-D-alanine carboxypeptidase family protein [Paenirhodobacter sp.]
MRLFRLAAIACLALTTALPAAAFETRAGAAWVYDMTTRTVLLEKQADVPLPPASMSKLMTLNMLFEALDKGIVSMDTEFAVSTKAKSMGGSTMFLNEMDRPTVNELMQGMIINSGNDACVVVAENLSTLEGLGGTEEAFAARMTKRAPEIGLTQSQFANASGWPDPGQRMSVHDLGVLAAHLISAYPQHYPLFSETSYDYKSRSPANANNRNPLLAIKGYDWHADGMKTGHTQEAGYGLVGSAVMGDRRIVFVLSGMESEKERAQEGEAIANWAFHQFTAKTLAAKGTKLAEVPVWLGAQSTVGLVSAEDVRVLVPAGAQGDVKAEIVYNGPITLPVDPDTQKVRPIKAGDHLADLVIQVPGLAQPEKVPLLAQNDVTEGGFLVRVRTAAQHLMQRVVSSATHAVGS